MCSINAGLAVKGNCTPMMWVDLAWLPVNLCFLPDSKGKHNWLSTPDTIQKTKYLDSNTFLLSHNSHYWMVALKGDVQVYQAYSKTTHWVMGGKYLIRSLLSWATFLSLQHWSKLKFRKCSVELSNIHASTITLQNPNHFYNRFCWNLHWSL